MKIQGPKASGGQDNLQFQTSKQIWYHNVPTWHTIYFQCVTPSTTYIYYERSGTQPPQGSWWNNSESKYLHISSFDQIFSSYVRKDLRYSLQFLNKPCDLDGDSLIEGGKLSKPENSANQRSTRHMWVETANLGAIIHTTTRIYNICKFQANSQNADAGQGIADWGPRGLRKHAKTPHGHPSIHHILNWMIFDKFLFMSITLCNLQPSSLNINYGI